MLIRALPSSGGGSSIWDNWPNLSDGTTITIFNNRVTNVTKNKAKKIGTDLYIELAGDMSVTSSNSGYDSWIITDAISIITDVQKNIDMLLNYDVIMTSSKQLRGFTITHDKKIATTTYGSGTYSSAIDFKIILHNQ